MKQQQRKHNHDSQNPTRVQPQQREYNHHSQHWGIPGGIPRRNRGRDSETDRAVSACDVEFSAAEDTCTSNKQEDKTMPVTPVTPETPETCFIPGNGKTYNTKQLAAASLALVPTHIRS